MNTVILFMTLTSSGLQNIIAASVLSVIALLLFVWWWISVVFQKWEQKAIDYSAYVGPHRPVDFPSPLVIKTQIPHRVESPNRMVLSFPEGCIIENTDELRQNLTIALKSRVSEIRVHSHWMSLEKLSDENWKQVLLRTGSILREHLNQSIEFKEVEQVASG